MAGGGIPERLRWAVETLDVQPGDELLEIGCGRGVAVELVCARLVQGKITAIDRSETATAAAARRNAAHVAAGRALIETSDLAAAELPPRAFDKVFAVNVNLFWVRSPRHELEVIGRSLRPSGALYLFYEPPGASRVGELTGKVTSALAAAGYATETRRSGTSLLCVIGHPRL